MEEKEKKAAELWGLFYTLTKEMLKFLEREDIDTFLQLLEQRGQVQTLLEKNGKVAWGKSAEGQDLYRQLMPLDRQVQFKVRTWLNHFKNNQKVMNAYDRLAVAVEKKSYFFNRQL